MPSIPELEKKWLRYRLKKTIPYIALIVVTIVLITIALIIHSTKLTQSALVKIQPVHQETNVTVANIKQPSKQNIIEPATPKSDTQLLLKPSMGFIDNIGNSMVISTQSTPVDEKARKTTIRHKTFTKTTSQKILPKQSQTVVLGGSQKVDEKLQPATPVQVQEQTDNIVIQTKPVAKDMKSIIKRFKETNNPMLSLFLAKRYYEQKKYTLAYNYALITNQLDKSNDESWIIFAKSLVKLGQTTMAVNTLKAYIQNSNSVNAKALLHDIQSGIFK